MYTYIEYPKALYLNGECATVNSREEEDALPEGWTDWNTDNDRKNGVALEKPKGKPGPKPKNQTEE